MIGPAKRFVTRYGWEKWIEVDGLLPEVHKLAVPFHPIAFGEYINAPKRSTVQHTVMFVRQPWNVAPWPREHVYVEEGLPLDDADRFAPNIPSLHRERALMNSLMEIWRIVEERKVPSSALVEAIVAADVLNKVERTLRVNPYVAAQLHGESQNHDADSAKGER